MAKTTINIKADKEVKEQAQRTAKRLGMPLSVVINAYLKQFIRTKEVHFSARETPKSHIRKRWDRIRKDIEKGKNLSPAFDNAEDAIRYLHSQ